MIDAALVKERHRLFWGVGKGQGELGVELLRIPQAGRSYTGSLNSVTVGDWPPPC